MNCKASSLKQTNGAKAERSVLVRVNGGPKPRVRTHTTKLATAQELFKHLFLGIDCNRSRSLLCHPPYKTCVGRVTVICCCCKALRSRSKFRVDNRRGRGKEQPPFARESRLRGCDGRGTCLLHLNTRYRAHSPRPERPERDSPPRARVYRGPD